MSPTTEEIRTARPLVTVLPEDVLSHATLIAASRVLVPKAMTWALRGSISCVARKQPLP